MSYYPCLCNGCTDCEATQSGGCDQGLCLKAANLVIHSNNSILPCGGSGTANIGAASDLTACTTTVNWFILPVSEGGYDDDAFTSVSIDSDGVLSFTTTTAIQLNTFYTFLGKVTCSDTYLSQFFTVKVSVKNACLDIVCPEDFECNPCDGTCVEAVDSELS